MKIRLIALLAVVALSVMAVPASAATADAGAFVGKATVDPALFFPGVGGAVTGGDWSLTTSTTSVAGTGSLSASGDLDAVAGLVGAYCGASRGHNGTGSYTVGATTLSLSNLEWVASAGGTLPVTGTATNGAESGAVVAVVQAQGGAPCATTGATEFDVVGVFAGATA